MFIEKNKTELVNKLANQLKYDLKDVDENKEEIFAEAFDKIDNKLVELGANSVWDSHNRLVGDLFLHIYDKEKFIKEAKSLIELALYPHTFIDTMINVDVNMLKFWRAIYFNFDGNCNIINKVINDVDEEISLYDLNILLKKYDNQLANSENPKGDFYVFDNYWKNRKNPMCNLSENCLEYKTNYITIRIGRDEFNGVSMSVIFLDRIFEIHSFEDFSAIVRVVAIFRESVKPSWWTPDYYELAEYTNDEFSELKINV